MIGDRLFSAWYLHFVGIACDIQHHDLWRRTGEIVKRRPDRYPTAGPVGYDRSRTFKRLMHHLRDEDETEKSRKYNIWKYLEDRTDLSV